MCLCGVHGGYAYVFVYVSGCVSYGGGGGGYVSWSVSGRGVSLCGGWMLFVGGGGVSVVVCCVKGSGEGGVC